MPMVYLKLFYDQIDALDAYSDEEVGRLIRGAVCYARDGIQPVFEGNERFIWPTFKASIDRSNAEYDNLCKTRQECAKKGGRPPKKPKGSSKNQKVFEEPKGFSGNQKNLREEDEEEKEEEKSVVVEESESTKNGGEGWKNLLEYYGFPSAGSDVDKVKELSSSYSEEWVKEAMKRTAQQQSRNWRYVRKILEDWQNRGGIDSPSRQHVNDTNGLNPWLERGETG